MKTPALRKLADALQLKAQEIGKEVEMVEFIQKGKELTAEQQERYLVCAWADGNLHGNWPWVSF